MIKFIIIYLIIYQIMEDNSPQKVQIIPLQVEGSKPKLSKLPTDNLGEEMIVSPRQLPQQSPRQQKIRQSFEIDLSNSKRQRFTKFTNFRSIQQKPMTQKNFLGLFIRNSVLSLSFFFFGYNLTSLSCLPEPVIENAYGVDVRNSAVKGFLIGCIPIGVCLGVLLAPFFVVLFSRKNFLYVVNTVAFIFTCLLQVGNIYFCIVCRLFQGICFACYMQVIPSYINELTCNKNIKYFGNMPQFFIVLGVDFSYAFQLIFQNTFDYQPTIPNTYNIQNQVFWRVIFCITPVVLILQTILLFIDFIPQSPNSLLQQGREEQAREVILMFNSQDYVQDIILTKMTQIQRAKVISQNTYDEELLHRFNDAPSKLTSIRMICLGFSLTIMQQMTGITAVVTQAGGIISFYNPSLGQYTPITITTVQLLATTTSIIAIQGMGVKANIMMGNLGMGIFNMINAVMFYFITWQPAVSIVFIGLIINMIIFGSSIGNSVGIYVSQIMPPKLVPISSLLGWIACSICVVGMPIVMDANNLNPAYAFFFFAGWTLFFFAVNSILISFKIK